MSEGVKELTGKVAALHALLADPHPGLYTWNLCLANALDEIAEWAPCYNDLRRKEEEKA
jgi:hypothetical protein